MRKKLILVFGVLLGSSLPASGQTLSVPLDLSQNRPAPGLTLIAASSRDLPLSNVMPERSLAEKPARLPVALAIVNYRNPDLKLPAGVHVEQIQTPFMNQVRVPMTQLWAGRLRLDAFAGEMSMKKVLDGPLRSGHPGTMQPRAAGTFGISLSFRLGRGASL